MVSEIVKTMYAQINGNELRWAGFKLSAPKENELIVYKGCKYFSITYDEASDTYSYKTTRTRKLKIVEEKEYTDCYCDQLSTDIETFFNFTYFSKPRFC
jgi:hypothetical protein